MPRRTMIGFAHKVQTQAPQRTDHTNLAPHKIRMVLVMTRPMETQRQKVLITSLLLFLTNHPNEAPYL